MASQQLGSGEPVKARSRRWAMSQRGLHVGHEDREENDFYPTPPAATRALLEVEKFEGAIWEPACGDGAMSKVLEAAGYEVVSTDLIDRGYGEGGRDFLCEWLALAPNVISNPPFKWAMLFIERALQLTTGKVAMFLRLGFLEGGKRGRWFPTTPLARVYVFSNRITFKKRERADRAEGGVVAFAWYVWEHGHEGPPTLHWIRADHKAGE